MGRNIIICEDQKPALSKLFYKFREKWHGSNRHEKTLKKKHSVWISELIHIKICGAEVPSSSKTAGGRPSEQFTDLSERSKRRKTKELRKSNTTDELTYAAQMSLRSSGQFYASKVMKDITITSPNRATKYIKAFTSQAETTLSGDAEL